MGGRARRRKNPLRQGNIGERGGMFEASVGCRGKRDGRGERDGRRSSHIGHRPMCDMTN